MEGENWPESLSDDDEPFPMKFLSVEVVEDSPGPDTNNGVNKEGFNNIIKNSAVSITHKLNLSPAVSIQKVSRSKPVNPTLDSSSVIKSILETRGVSIEPARKRSVPRTPDNLRPPPNFTCNKCDFVTQIRTSMVFHMMSVHLETFLFQCCYCEMKFVQKVELDDHVNSIHKRYKCESCDYRCVDKNVLKQHCISMHTNLKPYVCKECETCFSRKTSLDKHISAVHRGRKPFQCPECDYKASSTDVKRHINAVHKRDKPHQCEECSYTTSYVSALNRHVKTVHKRAKPHHCPYCSYECSDKRDLNRHVLRKHSMIEMSNSLYTDPSLLIPITQLSSPLT